jgi:iron complex transport system ATP-binding protein
VLEFRDVSFSYGQKAVLRHISAQIAPQKITCVLGKNASGKSTLFQLAAGLLGGYGGEILLDGRALGAFKPKERARHISILPQWRAIPQLTAAQLVAHGRYPHLGPRHVLTQEDQEKIRQAMERTDTAALAQAYLSALSGGQRQRVYLAMVIAQDAEIILLDEPTTYLDIEVQHGLLAIVRELKRQGKTVVMTLHDLALALEYSDALLLLEQGRLLASGATQEVLASRKIEAAFRVGIYGTENGYVVRPAHE